MEPSKSSSTRSLYLSQYFDPTQRQQLPKALSVFGQINMHAFALLKIQEANEARMKDHKDLLENFLIVKNDINELIKKQNENTLDKTNILRTVDKLAGNVLSCMESQRKQDQESIKIMTIVVDQQKTVNELAETVVKSGKIIEQQQTHISNLHDSVINLMKVQSAKMDMDREEREKRNKEEDAKSSIQKYGLFPAILILFSTIVIEAFTPLYRVMEWVRKSLGFGR
jgi:uncharacterized coiled-coil protein SlyX